MVTEIRIVNDELEFESNELGDKRTLKQLSDGAYALHKTRHQKNGADEISLSELAGASPVLTTPVINTSISGSAIATGAEVVTGTNNTKIVTPKAIGDAGLSIDIFKYRTVGNYYTYFLTSLALTTVAMAANYLYGFPFIVPIVQTFDRIAIRVSTLSAGNCRLGIYISNGNAYPTALILDAGEVDTGSTGVKEININQTLQPGLYWLAIVVNATPTVIALAAGSQIVLGIDSSLTGSPYVGWSKVFNYAALPNPYPDEASNITNTVGRPAVFLRKAA